MKEFETFKRISIGGIEKKILIDKLLSANIQFNEYAEMIFDHNLFQPAMETEKVSLAKVTQADLSIAFSSTFNDILEKAETFNLTTCPLCLGAFLRLSYMEQPVGPYLTIASQKPENDDNYPNGLYVRNSDGALWLRGYRASDCYEWPMEHEFIFLKKSKMSHN